MKQIQVIQKQIITVKDCENDKLTRREEYFWAEFIPNVVFDNEIFGTNNKKIASFCCVHYTYDNYTVITDNPILITLMIESGRISTDIQVFKNLADLDESKVDNYYRIIS